MGDEIKFKKLTGSDNWNTWKFNLKMLLMGKDLWNIVTGDEVLPSDTEVGEDRRRKYKRRDQLAMSLICLNVSESVQIYVRGAESAREAWNCLSDHFEEKTLSRKIQLHRKLYNLKLQKGTSMTSHVNSLKMIAEQLESLDDEVPEKYLVMILMSSVPESSYNNLITALETLKQEELTWNYVRDRFICEYERRKGDKDAKKSDDALFSGGDKKDFKNRNKSNNKDGKKQFKCHFCHQKGHFIKDCPDHKKQLAEEADKKQEASFCKLKLEDDDYQHEFALFGSVDLQINEDIVNSAVVFGSWSDDVTVTEDVESELQNTENPSPNQAALQPCVAVKTSSFSPGENRNAETDVALPSTSGEIETDEVVVCKFLSSLIDDVVESLPSGDFKRTDESLPTGDVKRGTVEESLPPGDSETGDDGAVMCRDACSLYPEEVALQTGDAEDSEKQTWWIDSGATSHMTGERGDFSRFENVEPGSVTLADKTEIASVGKGDVRASIFNGDDEEIPILLKDVLYVPGLRKRLLSISAFTESGATVTFQGKLCSIVVSNQKYQLGHQHGKLWKLNNIATCCAAVSSTRKSSNSLSLWHLRFGHLNNKDVQTLFSEKLVDGMEVDSKHVEEVCEGCALGKATRYPFPKVSSKKTTDVLELVHSDVCGPLNIPSVGGSIYFVSFIDDYSNYVWVHMLKRKSEVLEKFVEFVAMAENHSGRTLKKVRSDNAGEYFSNEIENFCKEKGILTEPTIPYTPQQNGKAERLNRTIMDNVRASLYHAKLPLYLWAEAVAAIVYLRNRSPTSSFKGATPYERWHGVKPDVGHLRAWGCNIYMHVPDEKRTKLEKKAEKGIFVGYPEGSKGYKIFNPETRKFARSRDVKFLESSFGRSDLDTSGTLKVVKSSDVNNTLQFKLPSHDTESDEETRSDDEEIPVPDPVDFNTRPIRNRRSPDRYGECATIAEVSEPRTYNQAVKHPNADKWKEAMKKEFSALKEHNTWKLVDLPEGKNLVGCKWVFKLKKNAQREIVRYKARLVAQGYSQEFGVDYNEVFAPVARYKSIRSVLAIANQFDLEAHQMDVVSAFLNGELEDEIYMKQPEGFVDQSHPGKVCKLNKSLYGLKQAARVWNQLMDNYLKASNYTQSKADSCVYYRVERIEDQNVVMIFAVYVDDTIILSNSIRILLSEKRRLSEAFEMDDRGEVHHILGMEVLRDRKNKIMTIDQKAYLEEVLGRFGMEDCKPISTPMEPGKQFHKLADGEEPADEKMYQAAVGSLNYAAIATRPDLSTAVGKLAQFMKNPSSEHWTAMKRVLRYIKGSLHLGLRFTASKEFLIHGFSDSDWAGCAESRKSTSGHVFRVGNCTLSWSSKKQPVIALSSTEAEYVALCSTVQEAVWLRSLFADVGLEQSQPTTIYEDNQGAMCLAKNPKNHPRTKHIDVKYHYTRDMVERNVVKVEYVPTDQMLADTLTKSLARPKFENFRLLMGVEPRLGA